MKKPRAKQYRIVQRDAATGRARNIGVLALAPDHTLSIVSAVSGRTTFLHDLAHRTNALEQLHVDSGPPEGAEEGALYTRPVPRTDAAFHDALLARLRVYYGIELEPA
jgi:hypothetical protein